MMTFLFMQLEATAKLEMLELGFEAAGSQRTPAPRCLECDKGGRDDKSRGTRSGMRPGEGGGRGKGESSGTANEAPLGIDVFTEYRHGM
jgi:hypothetical protein